MAQTIEDTSLSAAFEQQPPTPTPPLLIASMSSQSYESIVQLVQQLVFGANEDNTLLEDLSVRVVEYLTIERVQSHQVTATACSSTVGDHDLSACLTDSRDSWWMSRTGSMPGGTGAEYVEFQMSKQNVLRRLSAVSISIPPLPAGPASVRDFVLQAPNDGSSAAIGVATASATTSSCTTNNTGGSSSSSSSPSSWRTISPQWRLANRSGPQRFVLDTPGVDVDRVRVLCLSNQMSPFVGPVPSMAPPAFPPHMERVGFFSVSFD